MPLAAWAVIDFGDINAGTVTADQINVDNVQLNGNTISTTDTDGALTLDPDGDGNLNIEADIILPSGPTSTAYILTPNVISGDGRPISLRAASSSVAAGGGLNLLAGDGSTTGGSVSIAAGSGATDGSIIMSIPDAGSLKILKTGAVPSVGQPFVVSNVDGSGYWGTLGVGGGGTGITSGTSGGVPYFSSSSTIASSGALTANQLMLGGGAGAAPSVLAAGSQYQVLQMGAANPAYGAVNLAQSAAVTGTLPVANGGTGVATFGAGAILVGNGTSAVSEVASAAGNRVLVSGGVGFAPNYTTSLVLGDTGLGGTLDLVGTGGNSVTIKADPLTGNYNFILPIAAGTAGQYLKSKGGGSTPMEWDTPIGGTNNQREYILNGLFETDTSGWATYADAAGATPVNGTAGSPTVTGARTTTAGEFIRGVASYELAKDANNRQGEGFSYDFTVDYQDRNLARPVYISFDYNNTAAYASGDIQVFIYDKDAAAIIGVQDISSLSGALPSSTGGTTFTGVFYPTTAASDDYRLIFHIASTNASAYDFHVDSVHVGNLGTVPGAIITDWQAYTPTFTGLTTTSVVAFWWRRNGSDIEVIGSLTVGANDGATATVTLPTGLSLNTGVIGASQMNRLGSWGIATTTGTGLPATTRGPWVVHYNSSSATVVHLAFATDTDGAGNNGIFISATGTAIGITGKYWFNFKAPISGWSSSASLSANEALLSTVKARYTSNAGQVVATLGSPVIINFEDIDYDTNNAVTTGASWKFTAPKTAKYRACGTLISGLTGTAGSGFDGAEVAEIFLYKNNVSFANLGSERPASGEDNHMSSGCTTVALTKGDFIDFRYGQASGGNDTLVADGTSVFCSIDEQPDFSVFSVYPSDQWYVNASIAGGNPDLGVAAVTAFTEMISSTLTMTPVSGSAPVGIMCSTTNAAKAPSTGATTCDAGSESIGANFAIPEPGVYEVCFQFSWGGQADTAEEVNPAFEAIETPLTAQTLTLEGGGRVQMVFKGMTIAGGADQKGGGAGNVCGIFDWRAFGAGTVKGVRLMYEQSIGSAPDASTLFADADGNNGQRNVHVRARKY